MKKIFIILLAVTVVSILSTQQLLAQNTDEACTESKLRSQRVSFLSCNDTEDQCTVGAVGDTGVAAGSSRERMVEWIDKYGQLSFDVGKKFGIPYEAILAQSALESGWGDSDLTKQGNNFFGIKTGKNWTGGVWTGPTQEEFNGNRVSIVDGFRTYPTIEAGFNGYGEFITSNSRYRPALAFPGNPEQYIIAIKNAGYATASEYVPNNVGLIRTIKSIISETNKFPPSSQVTPDVAPPTNTDATTTVSQTSSSCADPSSIDAGPNTNVRVDTPKSCSGKAQTGTIRLKDYIIKTYGARNLGIYSCRSIVGGSSLSVHAEGRAFDAGLNVSDPNEKSKGDELFAWSIQNAAALGVQEVIWNRQRWSPSNGIKPYNGKNPHTDHVHISQNWDGANATTLMYTEGVL